MSAINKTELEANWSLISSDPDVFNDMLRAYDISEVVMQEAYSVTFDGLISDSPVYGVIYTSRYDYDERLPENIEEIDADSENIVFTSQIVTNACATLALLSILLNANIDKGKILEEFASFTNNFSPINRGIALGNSPHIRKIHNSYAIGETRANEAIQADESLTEDDVIEEDNFHFVSYIPKDGFIWELDGLKNRPIKLAPIKEDKHWLEILGPILAEKMSTDDQCNILVAIKNPLIEMKKNLANYKNELDSLTNEEGGSEALHMEEERKNQKRKRDDDDDDDDFKKEKEPPRKTQENIQPSEKVPETLQNQINLLESEINEYEEQTKKDISMMTRQKFDYFPFISQLISKVHQYQMTHPPIPPPSAKEAKTSKISKKNTKTTEKKSTTKKTKN